VIADQSGIARGAAEEFGSGPNVRPWPKRLEAGKEVRAVVAGMHPATSDEVAVLRAVVTVPEDDAPRLVYADWCDDHGHPERALMIRHMVAVPSTVFIWNQSLRAFRPRLWHEAPHPPKRSGT
jgi:uncharacterized protein (TIGR02996 family)